MTHLTYNDGCYITAEKTKDGKLRCKVPANKYSKGAVITLRRFDPSTDSRVDTRYKITGVGAIWKDRGFIIDEEDSRSFGGNGAKIHVKGDGEVQYAYIEVIK